MSIDNNWSVSLEPLESADTLRADWTALEERADASFFQSWGWIGCWLSALPAEFLPEVLRVRCDNRLVGLGLLHRSRQRRHAVIRSRIFNVSETGDPRFDGITVEHNGWLTDATMHDEVVRVSLRWLTAEEPRWDELVVRGIEARTADRYRGALPPTLTARLADDSPYYFVDLSAIRDANNDYLSSLSRNSRYQVRRAIKGYSSSGPLTLRVARTPEEGNELFAALRRFHDTYWQARGEPGAFGDEFRRRFHRNLIDSRFAAGEIQLIEVSSPTQPVGYLYNFRFRGTVSNYQSGFNYSDDPKLKPGLVTHALAIQHYLEGDESIYDFLMGQHRYKKSLSNSEGTMGKLVVQRPRVRFRIEDTLRRIRGWLPNR